MRVSVLHVKRAVLPVLLTLLLSVAGMTNAMAQTITVGDLIYSLNDDGVSVTVTGHVDGISGTLTIPESITQWGNTYPVTAIGDNAFYNCYGLTGDLVIPNSVTSIGYWAFYDCYNLTSLTIGNSVTHIYSCAFYYCDNFTGTLTIPENVTQIDNQAFEGCFGFTSLDYNATNCLVSSSWLFYIGNGGTYSWTTVNIGENVQVIPDNFLKGCSSFVGELVIPNSVTSIGSAAFEGCSGFTGSLAIPNNVTSISNSAFSGCSGFTGSLTIPDNVTTIGSYAFSGCSGFTGSLIIPDNMTSIGEQAFLNCTGFSGTLTLGQSLSQINNSAFFGACENFTSFNVLAEVPPTLGTNVFTSVNYGIPVQVTCGTLEAYQNASGWSNFTNLQETNPCIWEITATAIPTSGGTVSGAGTYEQGHTCTLTAIPNEDYAFVSWTENNEVVSAEASYSFTVTGDRNLVANFRNLRYDVWVAVQPEEGGTVSASESGRSWQDLYYDFDDSSFQGWTTIDGGSPSGYGWQIGSTKLGSTGYGHNGSSDLVLSESYDNSYGAISPDNYLVSPQVMLGGSITFYACAQDASYAAEHFGVAVSMNSNTNPSDFQMVQEWTMTSKGVGAPTEVTRSGNRSQGNWYQYTVDLSAYSGQGYVAIRHFNCWDMFYLCVDDITISTGVGEPVGSYLEGETCTLTATPNEDYAFVNWTEDGEEVSTEASYAFTVTGNRYLVAHFRYIRYEITATAIPEAGGTISGSGSYLEGETCTLTATPLGEYEFGNWTENGVVVSTDAIYTFTVETSRNLVANFTNPNFIIFVDPNVEARCVELWDSDGDGFLSYDEAAAVTSLGRAFEYWGITSFDELQYFTGLTYLNSYEFYGCGNLTSITLPENITYIYYEAFAECYNLSSITVLANMPPQIDDSWSVFYGIDRSIPIAVPCNTTSSYQNAYGWNEFSNYQEPGYCIYEITAAVNNEEAGTVSGDIGSYQRGQTCTLVATPNEGWGFYYWMENGVAVSSNAEYSFVVTSNRDLVAVFGIPNAFGILGNTTYDWQSNKGAITRTIVWPDGKVNFAFTQATEASFSDRGTGIGTYDAANEEWIPSDGRVENEKTGFGSIARYGQNGIVVASHTANDSRIYIIEDKDNIEANSVPVTSILDNTYNIEWPNVMTSGPNRNIIHVVATPYDSYTSIPGMENVYQPILYFRSQDGGQTWDKQNVVLPFMTAEYGLSWGSNCCYWMETTEDNCLALVVNNPWSDGMVIYSYDNGETWERKVFYKHPDPFSYHDDILVFPRWTSCQWDSDHNLHVLYEFNGTTGDPGSGSYYPSFGGIAYWNETMPYNVAGTTQSAIAGNLIPGQPFVMDNDYLYNDILSSSWWWSGATHEMWPEYIGYLPTLDDNGNWEDPYQAASFNIEDRSRHGSYNSGVCSFPVLCNVPGTNDMVAVWCAMDENNTDENGNYYYKIFASYSVGGYQWTNMMQLTNDVMFQHTECTYLQAVVVGDRLVIASQMDGQTGTYVQSDDYDPYDNHYIGLTFDLTELFGVVPGNSFYIATSTNFAVGGTVSGAGIYELGQTCTLTATPNEEFEFVNWTENGEVVSTDETYSFAVTGHRNLVANFHLVNVNAIVFADPNVEAICVANWDVDSDGALCYSEAALVSDLGWKFSYNTDITSFDELQYFTKVVSINDDAFRNCIGLTSIILPEHVTFIGSDAFRNCCGLRGEITLPESLESVGEYAFYGCDGISTVNYNAINCQTMGSVEYPVFYDCAFTHLNIGENVQSIPNFAFRRCFMITDMTVAAVNPPTISSGTFGMVSRSIPVSVPHGSGDAYSNAPYWEEFFNIIEVYFNDVQTVPLAAGWNWFSSNLDITLDDLKSALVEALPGTAITIKSRSQNTAYNPSTNRWRGTLNSLDVTQMYMISVGTGGEITLSGTPIDPAEHPITINNGTNWIAFPLSENMTVSNAFAGFAVNGDKVKSRNGNSQYIRNRWSGGVTTLVPGQGYMYISTTQEPRVLTFPASAK